MAELRRARPLLGTLVEIQARGPIALSQLHAAIDAAFGVMARIHTLMSAHEPDSDVGRLNRHAPGAPALRVDAHTAAVLRTARHLSRRSAGAFDVTVAPRLESWGYLPAVAAPIDPAADWRAIELLPGRRVRLRRAVRIDLGGIAKGYAVDRAIDTLAAAGVAWAVVNAGGDLRSIGTAGAAIALRHPLEPSRIGSTLCVRHQALATSSACFSRRERAGSMVSALFDPRSGLAYTGERSVSVIAPECMLADALTKVLLFAPPAVSRDLLRACGARAIVLDAEDRASHPTAP